MFLDSLFSTVDEMCGFSFFSSSFSHSLCLSFSLSFFLSLCLSCDFFPLKSFPNTRLTGGVASDMEKFPSFFPSAAWCCSLWCCRSVDGVVCFLLGDVFCHFFMCVFLFVFVLCLYVIVFFSSFFVVDAFFCVVLFCFV